MQRIRYWVRNFFGFSRTQINGLLILLPLMVVLIFSQPLYRKFLLSQLPNRAEQQRNDVMDSLVTYWDFNPAAKKSTYSVPTYFRFNPNSISKEKLQQLGLAPYLAQRIINYRSKGGSFTKSDDLLKIYGIDSSWYNRITDFIYIPARRRHVKDRQQPIRSSPRRIKQSFDLNKVDSIQLQSISGIGPVLAARIVRYRNTLGGFVKADQIKEVYGLNPGVVTTITQRSFIAPNFVARQIDINGSTKKLVNHPYIKYRIAKLISTYRFQHGDFRAVNDLLKIDVIDSVALDSIRPYIKAGL